VKCLVLAVLYLTSRSCASAIIIRHDRDDVRYIELGKRYPAVCGVSGATGTLVGRQWVLTAAHVAEDISPLCRGLIIQGKEYPIAQIAIHPDFLKRGIDSQRDLALIRLESEVVDVQPVELYDRDDEVGKTVVFVGNGLTGTGLTGPRQRDGVRRAATNQVESADGKSIRFAFDAPPGGLDLEGISGPGDSGGPALMDVGGKLCVLGVSSTNSGDEDECRYGTIETYARVSTALKWLRETIRLDGKRRPGWSLPIPLTESSSNNGMARIAADLLRVYNSGAWDSVEQFNQTHRPASSLKRNTSEERKESFGRNWNLHGSIKAKEMSVFSPRRFAVSGRGEKSGHPVSIEFKLVDGRSPRLDAWSIKAGRSP